MENNIITGFAEGTAYSDAVNLREARNLLSINLFKNKIRDLKKSV